MAEGGLRYVQDISRLRQAARQVYGANGAKMAKIDVHMAQRSAKRILVLLIQTMSFMKLLHFCSVVKTA
ncbi:MAG: hypothetical protein AAFN44_14560 [Pseudomonadota bacterium]